MIVRFKKLSDRAVIPTKAHPTDAGFDLTATRTEIDEYGCFVCHTDIAVEIPRGYVGLVFPRSSVVKTGYMLGNGVGVIDSCYRNEITLKFKPASRFDTGSPILMNDGYTPGYRVGQLIIMPYPEIEFEEAEELSETDRGMGGYGSTGR